MDEELELIDPQVMGIYIDGMSIETIKKLKKFYQARTGDLDLEKLDHFLRFN